LLPLNECTNRSRAPHGDDCRRAAAQVQGGTLFGLTAALHGSITFKDGRIKQSNFDSYLPMRIDEVPVVETYFEPA